MDANNNSAENNINEDEEVLSSFTDGDSYYIYNKENPNEWIRSTTSYKQNIDDNELSNIEKVDRDDKED